MTSADFTGGMIQPPSALPRMAPLGAPTQEPPAVQLSGLSKTFGSTAALTDVSLSIPPGSVYALVGPNGSGKTTLLRLLTGLIRPDKGQILVMGSPVTAGTTPHPSVAFVPERYALYDSMSVGEHVDFAARFAPRWDHSFVQRSLEGLQFDRSKKVGDLSQGRRAQLALLMALGGRPDLLILDEPTANLDPIMRRDVHRLVIGEASARGQTILLSSHNLTEVERVADRVGFLRQGKLVAERIVDEIRSQEHEVRVVLQSTADVDLAKLPGVMSVERQGGAFRLRVSGNLEPVLTALQELNPFALEVVEQSLEDLFFAYSGADGAAPKEV